MIPLVSQSALGKRALTVAELLVAIAVIAIFLALLFPAFNGTGGCGPGSKAGAVVRSISNAIKSFETDYDTPPMVAPPRNEREHFIFVGDPKSGALHSNAALFDVLRAIPRGVNANHVLNPRRQKYFEESKATDPKNPRDGFADGKEFAEHIQGRLLDPHGSEYCVVIDTSKEGVLDLSGIYTDLKDPIRYPVISFSLGKDRQLGTNGNRMFRVPRSNAPPEDTVSFQ